MSEQQLSELTGSVKRITFHNPMNGWTVVRLFVKGESDEITAVGNFSTLTPGENLKLSGYWISDPNYGPQFKVINYELMRPATVAGIEKYLGSGLIKGVGPVTARRLVERFGLHTLDVIEADPERLMEVKGISAVRIERIKAA